MSGSATASVNRVCAARPRGATASAARRNEFFRRLLRRPRSVSEGPNLLPLLIRVLACFSKLDGKILEEEIDSSLGFLRHDYPEAVYSELRKAVPAGAQRAARPRRHGRQAQHPAQPGPQNSPGHPALGPHLPRRASSRSRSSRSTSSWPGIGMTAQAIDIVYQLNASDVHRPRRVPEGRVAAGIAHLRLGQAARTCSFQRPARRRPPVRLPLPRPDPHQEPVLRRRSSSTAGRSRAARWGGCTRASASSSASACSRTRNSSRYFNAKKNVAIPQVYLAINKDDEVSFERARTRDSVLEVRFGLKVQVTALRRVNARLNGIELKSRHAGRGHAGRQDRLPQRQRTAADRPAPPRPRARRPVPAPRQQERIPRFQQPEPARRRRHPAFPRHGRRRAAEDLVRLRPEGRPVGSAPGQPRRSWSATCPCATPRGWPTATSSASTWARCCAATSPSASSRRSATSSACWKCATCGIPSAAARRRWTTSTSPSRAARWSASWARAAAARARSCARIAGQNWPDSGGVVLNGRSLYDDLDDLRGYISYIPQDDAFDEQLTIEENLTLAAALRSPHLSRARTRPAHRRQADRTRPQRTAQLASSAAR